jgi:hypothetical protein
MEQVRSTCQVCGQPAKVCIRESDVAGEPVLRYFCLTCADRLHDSAHIEDDVDNEEQRIDKPRLPGSGLLIAAGVFIAMLGALGGHLGIRGSPGFGWYQTVVLVSAVLLVIIGGLFGVDVIMVIAGITAVLAACSDLLGLSGDREFGWKKESAVVIGVVLTVVGFYLSRPARRARNKAQDPPGLS